MPDNSVNVKFDAASAMAEAKAFADTLLGQADAVKELAGQMAKYNNAGEVVRQSFKAILTSGNELEVSLKKTARGYDVVTSAIKRTAEAAKAQAAAQKAIVQNQRVSDAKSAETTIVGLPGTGSADSVAKVNALEASIRRVKSAIENGGVSLQRFNELLKQVQANPKGLITGLTGEEQKVVSQLRAITGGFKDADAAGKGAGERILITWQGVTRLFQSQVLRQSIRFLISEFQQSIEGAKELSIKFAQLEAITQGAGKTTADWSAELTKLSNSYGVSQIDVANAAYQSLQSNIIKAGNTGEFLNTALKLSSATTLDTKESVQLLASTMNAFRISATGAEDTANILYKTMTLGGISATEFSSEFGKLGNIATQSGLKLEEVGAAVDALTQKGVRFSDASQIIQNVLEALSKPTKQMKDLFADLGVSSGKALVQLEGGFGGVLRLFDKIASEGGEKLGDLTGKFRELKAITALTGDTFDLYNSSLEKITNTSDDLTAASDKVKDSLGKEFQRELEKVKNYFLNDFGTTIAREILQLGKILGGEDGLVGAAKRLVFVIKEAAFAFVAFRAATIATSGVQYLLALRAAYLQTATAATTATTAATAFNISTGNLLGVAAALGAIAYGAGVFGGSEKSGSDLRADAISKEQERQRVEAEGSRDVNRLRGEGEKQLSNELKAEYSVRYGVIQQYSANVLKLAESLRKRAVDNLKDVTEQTKVTAATYTDSLKKTITDLGTKANEAKHLIQESLKIAEDIPKHSTDSVFAEKQKYASGGFIDGGGAIVDNQKAELYRNRINQLQKEAREKFKEGTKEGVAEARKMFSEIEKLQNEQFTQATDLKKKAAEDDLKKFGYSTDPNVRFAGIDRDGKPRYEYTVKTAEVERNINTLAKERLALEENFRAVQAKRQLEEQAAAAKEKARLIEIQEKISEAAKFSVLDKDGKVQEKYKKDPKLASTEFQGIIDDINKLAGPEAIRNQFQFFSDIYKQRTAIVKQVQVQIRAEEAKTLEENIIKSKEAQTKQVTNAQEAIKGSRENINKELEKLAGALADTGATGTKRVEPGYKFGRQTESERKETAAAALSEDARKIALAKLEIAKSAQIDFVGDKSVDSAKKLKTALNDLADAIEKYQKRRASNTGELDPRITFAGDAGSGRSAKDKLDELRGIGKRLLEDTSAGVKGTKDIQDAQVQADKLTDTIKKIPDNLKLFMEQSAIAQANVGKSFAVIVQDIDKAVQKAIELNTVLEALNKNLPAVKGRRPVAEDPNLDIPGGFYGGKVKHMAFGGRGSDDQLAMLDKREYVMNAQATQQFLPMLQAMNGGGIRGSTVNNGGNIGDIHIHHNGGGTTETQVKEIAKSLRREIRRGTISLGG